MSEQQETSTGKYPEGWHLSEYKPRDGLMKLGKGGSEYLTVQHRVLWFVQEMRALIASGLATMPYVIRTEQVELDRDKEYACFKTYICDVLGNEATMYGSEQAKDFPDYAEKASTKSVGRALIMLGYGTASAQELDEGERVVDSPVERRAPHPAQQQRQEPRTPAVTQQPQQQAAPAAQPAESGPATQDTLNKIAKICEALGIGVPTNIKSEYDALARFRLYKDQWLKAHPEAAAKAS